VRSFLKNLILRIQYFIIAFVTGFTWPFSTFLTRLIASVPPSLSNAWTSFLTRFSIYCSLKKSTSLPSALSTLSIFLSWFSFLRSFLLPSRWSMSSDEEESPPEDVREPDLSELSDFVSSTWTSGSRSPKTCLNSVIIRSRCYMTVLGVKISWMFFLSQFSFRFLNWIRLVSAIILSVANSVCLRKSASLTFSVFVQWRP